MKNSTSIVDTPLRLNSDLTEPLSQGKLRSRTVAVPPANAPQVEENLIFMHFSFYRANVREAVARCVEITQNPRQSLDNIMQRSREIRDIISSANLDGIREPLENVRENLSSICCFFPSFAAQLRAEEREPLLRREPPQP
jgi:hypothetical protein